MNKMSKKTEKFVCPICGKKFTKKAVNQKYCSHKCKRAAAKKSGKAKPVAKKIADKVKLPKAPVIKKDTKKPIPAAKGANNPVAIIVRGGDSFRKFGLALCIAFTEFAKILVGVKSVDIGAKKTKKAK